MSTAPIVLDYERFTLRDRTDKFKQNLPAHVRHYICSFFPIFSWITRYNTAVSNMTHLPINWLMPWHLVDDTGCNCRNDSRNDVCAPRHCLCKDCQPGSPVWLIVRIQIPTLFVHSFDVMLTFVRYVVPPLLAHVCIVYLVHLKTSVLVPSVSHPFLYTPVILTHMPYFSRCFFVGGTCNYKCHYSTSRYQRA